MTTVDVRESLWRLRTAEQVLAESALQPAFLLDGLLHASSTLLSGPPKSGKSFLAAEFATAVATGNPWHGRSVGGGGRRVAILTTDPNGEVEYARRLEGLQAPMDMIELAAPRTTSLATWEMAANLFRSTCFGLVVVDNLYSLAPPGADVNSNADMSGPLACFRAITDAELPIVVVHHSPKTTRGPAGTQAIKAWFRHCLDLDLAGRLKTEGNDVPGESLRLTRADGVITALTPWTARSTGDTASAMAEEQAPGGRSKAHERYAEAVAILVQEPPDMSRRWYARQLSKRMDSVGSEDAGLGLLKALAKNGMWPPGEPTGGPDSNKRSE